jgi:phage shock protein A
MGVFRRVRDIINSNINSVLDKAEDPEKLVRLMIQEMDETLVEVKSACAGAMAAQKRVRRQLKQVKEKKNQWGERARLAVDKDRDDLARDALRQQRECRERVEDLEDELSELDSVVGRYQEDIRAIEEKIAEARERQRMLLQRRTRAQRSKEARQKIREYDAADAMARFESVERRIDRLDEDAEAFRTSYSRSLEQEFEDFLDDQEIEDQLRALKEDAAARSDGD